MYIDNLTTRLSIILAEACPLLLLYHIIMGLTGDTTLVYPHVYILAAIVLGTVNIVLSHSKQRVIVLALINLFIIFLLEIVAFLLSGKLTFVSLNSDPFYNVILFHFTFTLLLFRAIYIPYKKVVDVYGHFDFFIVFSFLVFILSELVEVSIKNPILWILIIFFLNLLPLYVKNRADRQESRSGWLIVAFIVASFIIAKAGYDLLPSAVGTADFAFSYIESTFNYGINVLKTIILFLMQFSGLAKSSAQYTDSGAPTDSVAGIANVTDPSWAHFIKKAFVVLFAIIILYLAITLLYFILRKLISLLFKKRTGGGYDLDLNPYQFLKNAFISIISFFRGIVNMLFNVAWIIYTFLPFGKSIQINKAYERYLRWGARRRLPRKSNETPNEYCERLSIRFPILKDEFNEITNLFVFFAYSNSTGVNRTNVEVKFMLRKIYLYNFTLLKMFIKKHRFMVRKKHTDGS